MRAIGHGGRGVRTVLLAVGLAQPLMVHTALAQGPLQAPFGRTFDLETLLPAEGGDGSLGFVLEGLFEGEAVGESMGSAGDVNGDGIDDVLIGAPRFGGGIGAVYVVFGRREGWPAAISVDDLLGDVGFRIVGHVPEARAGTSVASAGDFNGDGIDDIVVGAPGGGYTSDAFRGSTFVVYGRPAGTPFPSSVDLGGIRPEDGFRISGWRESMFGWARAGREVAGGGDINGDGFDDVVVATSLNTVGVVLGGPDPITEDIELIALGGPQGFRVVGIPGEDNFSGACAIDGDINGDGFDDLVVSSPRSLPSEYCYTTYGCYTFTSGRSYIMYGRGTPPFGAGGELLGPTMSSTPATPISTGTFDARLGEGAAHAGDINGDGFGDLVLGSPGVDFDWYYPAKDDGEAHVIFGSDGAPPTSIDPDLLDGSDGFAFRVPGLIRARMGERAAPAGDINNDGIADVLIGSPGSGLVHAVFGRSGAFAPVVEADAGEAVWIRGVDSGDRTASGVGGNADVNGDGVADILIGAPGADPGGRRGAGRAYVVFGRGACRADLDGDGALTIFDFLAFGNLFDLMDPIADFDGDGELTLFDFLAFQTAFDAGCP